MTHDPGAAVDIRLVTNPTVTIIGRPAFDEEAAAKFLAAVNGLPVETPVLMGQGWHGSDGHPEGQVLIESGGRVCYQSYSGGRPHADHVRHLVSVGHWSCLEHASYTLLIAGVSRSLSHELVRHRHHSPSQLSQRYVDQGGHRLGFVVPPGLLGAWQCWERAGRGIDPTDDPAVTLFTQWNHTVREAAEIYAFIAAELTDRGMPRKSAREAARSVLPECAETRLQLSGNLRAWVEYLLKRCSQHADAEHRRLACVIYSLLAAEAPDVFAGFGRRELSDGTFEVVKGGAA